MNYYLDGIIFLSLQHLLGLLAPGPCTGLVMRNSLYDRTIGMRTVFGSVLGSFSIKFISIMGFAFLLQNNPAIFFIFKLCGASYLIFLGLHNFYKSYCAYKYPSKNIVYDYSQSSPFIAGYITSLTNPISSIRFTVIFSTVITADISFAVQVSYLLILAFISLVFYSIVSLFFSTHMVQKSLERYNYIVTAVLGVTLAYWGFMILSASI